MPPLPLLLLRVSLGLLIAAGLAHAEPRTPRFHLATPELEARLWRNPRVGRNIDAVAEYRRANGRTGGTAFLVTQPDASGTALVLTNHHVALFDKDAVQGDALVFHPRGGKTRVAKVISCITSDPDLDFALLSVKLPRPLRELRPVRISLDGDRGVDAVYNAAFPRIWDAERKRVATHQPSLVAVDPLNRPAYRNALAMRKLSPKTLQVGRINREFWVEPYINLRLANEVGSSGSPVFGKGDHLAFGILSMGGGNSDAMARPLRPMLEQIAARRQQIADPSLRQTVDRMLKAAGMPSVSH